MVYIELENEQSNLDKPSSGQHIPHALPSDVEEQVQLLRALNQQAQQVGTSEDDVQLSISEIRNILTLTHDGTQAPVPLLSLSSTCLVTVW